MLSFSIAFVLLASSATLRTHALPVTTRQNTRGYVQNHEVYVHLFEWPHEDVARECEEWLAPMGYKGVQISPPQEHVLLPNNNPPYPWWQRYQAVSYILQSRSGNQTQLEDMVRRCNAVGIEIYVDAIFQHTTGPGSGVGSAGSSYNADTLSFPAVPYSSSDFHGCGGCNSQCEISTYNDRYQVQNCRLVGLRDLNTEDPSVQSKIAAYMSSLVDIGVAGFRMDAVKHVAASSAGQIFAKVSGTPYIYQEVIGAASEPIQPEEYIAYGRVSEFQYSYDIARMINNNELHYMQSWGEMWGYLPDDDAVAFVDNHDNQRGHGGGGDILTHMNPEKYRIANVYMLAWPYGWPQVMSSYYFNDTEAGPPSDSSGKTQGPNGCKDSRWVCEHRWTAIANMVRFRRVAGTEPVLNWWTDNASHISYSRGNKAFLAISTYTNKPTTTYQTGLPAGRYCNVVQGPYIASSNTCTGETVTVDSTGKATFSLSGRETPAVALHVEAVIQ